MKKGKIWQKYTWVVETRLSFKSLFHMPDWAGVWLLIRDGKAIRRKSRGEARMGVADGVRGVNVCLDRRSVRAIIRIMAPFIGNVLGFSFELLELKVGHLNVGCLHCCLVGKILNQ